MQDQDLTEDRPYTDAELRDAGIEPEKKLSRAEFMVSPIKFKREGREGYIPTICIRIWHSKNTIPVIPVQQKHKDMYPKLWNEFLKSEAYQLFCEGGDRKITREYTPLTELAGFEFDWMQDWDRQGIRCVEDLAEKSVADVAHIYLGQIMRNRAIEYVGKRALSTPEAELSVEAELTAQEQVSGAV
jgi:hypothetical protein